MPLFSGLKLMVFDSLVAWLAMVSSLLQEASEMAAIAAKNKNFFIIFFY